MSNDPPHVLTPAPINAKAVFGVGTILWCVALMVLGVLHLTDISIPGRYPIICGAGIALGVVGYWWAHQAHLVAHHAPLIDDGFSE